MPNSEFDPAFDTTADDSKKNDGAPEVADEVAFAEPQHDGPAADEVDAMAQDEGFDTEAPAEGAESEDAELDLEAAPQGDGEDLTADDAEGADVSEGDKEADAPIADDGNVVDLDAIEAPPAEAQAIAPSLSTDVAADSEDKGDAEAEGEEDVPAKAAQAPLDEIRSQAQPAGDHEPDASAGIVPQPKPEDALAERPLSGIASDEARGAVDAMPAAAQQHMGSWVKGVYEAEPAEPGQLPTTADLPGTPLDATAVGTYSDRGVTRADEALEARADNGDDKAQAAVEHAGGILGEGAQEGDEDGEEGLETSDQAVDTGADAGVAGNSDGYFGAPKVQNGPLVDVAEDAVDAFKQAAEQAALAQNHFQNVPLAALDVEHKDLLVDLRVVMGDLLRLAARFFERGQG